MRWLRLLSLALAAQRAGGAAADADAKNKINKLKFHNSEVQPDVAVDGVQAVLDWSKKRLTEAEESFSQSGYKRYPSPQAWDSEVVYYVLVDRFANGDRANDDRNVPSMQAQQMASQKPFTVGQWRHGGDLQGVRTRLGYLQELGVTTVWLSPILLNNDGSPWGYYMSDPTLVDPGFGSRLLLRELVHEAHERGIRVVMDIIVNMASSDGFQYADPGPSIDTVTACSVAAEYEYWNKTRRSKPRRYNTTKLTFGDQMPPFLRNETFFQGCGPAGLYRPLGREYSQLPADPSDYLATYLEAGFLWPESFSSPAAMPDFATMNPVWQELYTNLMMYWMAYADVDGFRLDAVKYVSADLIAYFSTHTRGYGQTLGKNNLFLTGEILSPGGVPFVYLYLGKGPAQQMESAACLANEACAASGLVGDCCPSHEGFQLACCFSNRKKGKPIPRKVADVFEELKPLSSKLSVQSPALPTFYPTDGANYVGNMAKGISNATEWWTNKQWVDSMSTGYAMFQAQEAYHNWTWQMVESQDMVRLLQHTTRGNEAWRLEPAITWSYTWWGVPTLYYGLEQGLNGLCYQYNADGSQVSVIDKWIKGDPLDRIKAMCDANADDALKRQDFFTGGPFVLGSAIPEVQASAKITGKMMDRSEPNWCQEPLLNRENKIFLLTKALGRIRKSCRILGSTQAYESNSYLVQDTDVLAFWKLPQEASTSAPAAALVWLDFNNPPLDNLTITIPAEVQGAVKVGGRFVDLLQPQRLADVVDAGDGVLVLRVVARPEGAHTAIFVPVESAQKDESAAWMVCKAGAAGLPPLPTAKECQQQPLGISTALMLATLLLLVGILIRGRAYCGVFLCVVNKPSPVEVLEMPNPSDTNVQDPKHIFVAALEHTIPDRKVKVSAGGLGKVLDQMLREHPPGRLSLVHPKFAGVDYGVLKFVSNVEVIVDGVKETVVVSSCESTEGEIYRVWYLLEHKWFETLISKDAPYPYPQTKVSVLRFFSLWNQACAQVLQQLKPDVYHCMDYHAAMIPLYLPPAERIPTIIVLHNADYDGAVETDFVVPVLWQDVPALDRLSLIFNLQKTAIRKFLTFEGRFNMLWGGISCINESQAGHGICTVSGKYADELKRERTMFKGLPAVLPLDNAIDSAADDGPKTVAELKAQRDISKRALQEFCGLDHNPDAKILIFIGRWVKQKGVDHIALLAAKVLSRHRDVQFVLAGPPGDPYGNYAQELLRPLMEDFKGRLFVVTRFFMIPKEARAGAHFCLMPSCSEPFGYVDVEFGLLGIPSLGCAIGGLGKMPGIYFRQQNSDSQDMLLNGFAAAIQYALSMPDDKYWEMAFNCIPAQFPFSTWRSNLQAIYRTAMIHFNMSRLLKNGQQASADLEKTGFDYRRLSHRDVKMIDKSKSAGMWIHDRMQRLKVTESSEFLSQPVSEVRVKELMADWMKENQQTDAETLQSNISLADQRLNERSFATRVLMKSCKCMERLMGTCLRIHFFIALGYIVSPIIDAKLSYMQSHSKALSANYTYQLIAQAMTNAGCVVGSILWYLLSKQVPANLLMATSLFITERLCSLATTLSEVNLFMVMTATFAGGVLTSSRWLFLIWNFSEDFHGGFQIGTRRVAMIESCRQAVKGLLAAVGDQAPAIESFVLSFVVLALIILVMLAPSCYSSYVLPDTNFKKDIKRHKVYLLMTASMAINGLGTFCWGSMDTFLSINGWGPEETSMINIIRAAVLVMCLFVIFFVLQRQTTWGPWPMRDFVCFLPPGSLLMTLAFWEIGDLHYKSWWFVTIIVFAGIVDVARFAAMWTAILTTLANKWYALTGVFLSFGIIKACEAVSPFVCHGMLIWTGRSPVYSRTIHNHPETHLPTLQKYTLFAVWPLALLAYMCQLAAWRRFNREVLTYKGHGNLMSDGQKGWEFSETVFVPVHALTGSRHARSSGQLVEESDSGSDSETAGSTSDLER